MAAFHSVSAFCNAGFDLMGVKSPFSSLTFYADEPLINFPIMLLIIIGGIGFLTWDDIRANRFHIHKYRMQSKVIISTTAILILIPALYFYFFEFSDLGLKERIFSSLFQSVTPRTAGFNTVDLTSMSEAGQFITIILMLIGGSPGSTAGGMKTTTIAVLFAIAIATTSVRGLPVRGGRVWICIVPVCFLMVPRAGIEPAQPCGPGILSPLRLPVPPSGHGLYRILVSG